MSVISEPNQIALFRLSTLRAGLRLEIKGIRMTAKRASAYSILKRELNLKGNKQKVLDQVSLIIETLKQQDE